MPDKPDKEEKKVAEEARNSLVDLSAYPILTEEIGYPPSPLSRPSAGPQGPAGGGSGQGLGQIAASAISNVLGWKTNSADPKGFIGALTQAFTLTDVEGHIESKWNQRTYTVQTDLAGGITGAQASLYTRAKDAQDQCLPLLDGLYPLNPDADPEYVKALREMAKSQIMEIVKQFAVVPPSILRVNTYFQILLGHTPPKKLLFLETDYVEEKGEVGELKKQLKKEGKEQEWKKVMEGLERAEEEPRVECDPDFIGGTLGALRDQYGIWFQKPKKDLEEPIFRERPDLKKKFLREHPDQLENNPFSNSVEDEEDITNFRVISDYMTSLLQSWIANARYFALTLHRAPAFLGTQLILMSRQFNVIAETVNEVRFTLDSVFIGPNERQQLLLDFRELPSMYLEDVLREIDAMVTEEGPRLIRDGGRIAIANNLIPVVETLLHMIEEAKHPLNLRRLPDGYRTPRVQNSLDDLRDQILYLQKLARQVKLPLKAIKEVEIGS